MAAWTLLTAGGKDEGRDSGADASALFREGKAPADWKDVAFVRIGGGPKRAQASEDGEDAGGPGWLGAFSRQYKLIVAPGAGPSLFNLATDPDELNNLFTAPAQRETVRRLAVELSNYATQFKDPHLASPRVKADLAWAMSANTEYVAPAATTNKGGKGKGRKAKKNAEAR
ncbi:MAG: hypothetical protein M3463_15945 [Verrucomicrobiota bacterium]|nr:hypothetical protein [Verrucomicrobiota bacterium]